MNELPSGVLFDMDGLLLDTERLARDAFLAACRDLGRPPDLDVYHRCIGTTHQQTRQILTEAFGAEFARTELDELNRRWSARYAARLRQAPVPLKPGAAELLEWLAGRALPCALATSTRRATAETKLRGSGLLRYFQHLVCADETPRGKPWPDPYLAAAAGLGLKAETCWALEDSNPGVRAAVSAGCRVIQVPDLVAPDEPTRTELRRRCRRRIFSGSGLVVAPERTAI